IPTATVTNVSEIETAAAQSGSFNLFTLVSVANAGSPTGYVGGSAMLVSASVPGGLPAALTSANFLSSLVTIDADGTVHYDLSKFNFLAAGQSLSYSINFDVKSGTDTLHLALTFTVNGSDEAPSITIGAGDAAAAIIHDDTHATTLSAVGTLSFKDADATDGHVVSVTEKSGHVVGVFRAGVIVDTAGSDPTDASVVGDIGWAFVANKAHAQSLAAGESETEVFTITLDDGHGGTASQDVTVTVVGVNDAPVISGGPIVASVQEDGTTRATGQLTATDPDLTDTQTWSIVGASATHTPDYQFKIDEFKVVKNSNVVFDDTFSDGNPPPSVPSGS